MPKNGGRIRNFKNNEHFEHDDRTQSSNTRRVSFKPGTNKGKNKWNNAKLLLDDDIDMTGSAGGPHMHRNRAFRGRGGRLNSPAPRSGHGMIKKKFIPGPLPWYQIIIPYGAKHEKDVVLRTLLSYISPDIFVPHYYKINGNAAVFYVDDVKLAEKLFHADRKVTMSDGFKLMVIVRNAVPTVAIDAEMKEKMKLAMAKRYNATTKALDLTKFHADPELTDIFCALFRPVIMLAAIDIIAENIPDLEALNLNDNKLHGIEHLKIMSTKLKNLKILYMGDNRIPYIGSLEPLKSLPLVELYLKGNPLLTRFNDHEIYVRNRNCNHTFPNLVNPGRGHGRRFNNLQNNSHDNNDTSLLCIYARHSTETVREVTARCLFLRVANSSVIPLLMGIQLLPLPHCAPISGIIFSVVHQIDVRKKFPKLTKLDGMDLPPAIGFDVLEDVHLPPRQQSFLVDPAGQDLVREFLTQYFAIYDADSRQSLLEAYHEHATMSMAASYLTNDSRNAATQRLNSYITNSRNIMRITERESRRRYLRAGRLQVVSFLSDLPKTTHDLMGFAVDLLVFTPTMIVLVMNGVYKETTTSGNPVRSFHRTFVIVPNAGGGFCIINDMLFVTNTTKEQEDKAFGSGVPVEPTPPTPAPTPTPGMVAQPSQDETQKLMLATLSQQTGMNDHWSINCLQQTGWDFQRALFVFTQLNSEGKIPPEAFVK